MATGNIPARAQLSAGAEDRNELVSKSMHRLQHIAWRAVNVHGKKTSEFVIVCIEVDSRWKWLVDKLMPEHDWDAIRKQDARPAALGSVNWAICRLVAEEFPDIASAALETPPAGFMKLIALSESGCTVYDIEPRKSVT